MRDIPFVDAHVHLWDLSRIRYPWLTPPFTDDGPNGSVEAIARTYLLDDYLAEAANWTVAGIVHVDAGANAAQALDETDWLQRTTDASGMPNAIVAFADLSNPSVEALLAAQAAHPNVRGIRHIVNWHPDPRRTYTPRDVTLDDGWARGLGLLGKYGLSFDLQAYPGQFAHLARLIAQVPDTQVIINHAGMPVDTDDAGRTLWDGGLRALAALPNVAIKLSGFGLVHRPPSLAAVRPLVSTILDLFGTERVMAASDFPTDRLFANYDTTLDIIAASIADVSDDERRAIWARNANRIYRLGLADRF